MIMFFALDEIQKIQQFFHFVELWYRAPVTIL